MGRLVRVGALDPSLTHTGLVTFDFDVETLELSLIRMKLVETEKTKTKKVRISSDDLDRATEIATQIDRESKDWSMAFSEIPTGAQSARAATSFGMVIGLVAYLSLRTPVVQVQPNETKKASIGKSNAAKEDIFEWATEKYPNAPWIRMQRKGDSPGRILGINKNGHLSDAVAVAHAGVQTDEFRRSMVLLRSAA